MKSALISGETYRMAMSSPRDRLEMLEAFAGVTEHQKKYDKSMSDLKSSNEDIGEIEKLLENLSVEIDTMAEQTKELAKYQELDRKKRVISHVLHNKNRIQIEEKLRELRKKRDEEGDEISAVAAKMREKRGKQDNIKGIVFSDFSCVCLNPNYMLFNLDSNILLFSDIKPPILFSANFSLVQH